MSNIMKFLACDGMVKVTCVDTTNLIKEAKKIHNLSKVATNIFGQFITIGAMLSVDLKDDTDNLTLQVKSDYAQMTCVCKKGGKIKGYIQNEPLFENGNMYIIKDLGLKEPYVGITPIENGDIVKSFLKYYATSEQIPTVISAGVVFNDDNTIKTAGGYMLQLMPDVTEEVIQKIENIIKKVEPMTKMLEDNKSLIEIAKVITEDDDILMMLGELNCEYICECSKEKIRAGIVSLGKEEIQKIVDENKSIESVCHFCNKKYIFTVDEFREMLK